MPTSSFLLEEIWAAPYPVPLLLLATYHHMSSPWNSWFDKIEEVLLYWERKLCATATKCQKKNITRLYFRTFFKPTWKLRGSSLKIKLNMQSHSMFVVLSKKSYPNLSMIFIPHARNSKSLYELLFIPSACPLTSLFWLLSYVIYLKLTKVL